MRFPRITTRRWMLTVAVLAVPLTALTFLQRRAARFHRRAAYHAKMALANSTAAFPAAGQTHSGGGITIIHPDGTEEPHWFTRLGDWHYTLRRKYKHAARYPFLPLLPE